MLSLTPLSALSLRPCPHLPGPGFFWPFPASGPLLQARSLGQAVPGVRESSIYCLISMVTRRRRQRLPSPASQRRSTRRRDVYPPLPLCPYLAQPPRRGSAKAGIAIPSPPRPLPRPPSPKEQPAALIRAPPAPSRRPEGRRGAGALGTPVEGVAELMDELGALTFPDLWRLQSRFGSVQSVRGG